MRALILALLLSGCGQINGQNGIGIYIKMPTEQYVSTAHALTQLQIQSKNMQIQFGTEDNHYMVVEYAPNAELDNLFQAYILGVAWIYEEPCRIQMAERSYFYGQEWVNSVLWHEIGHCLGMEHHPNSGDIMYKYAKPLNKYSEENIQEFFRRLYEATR